MGPKAAAAAFVAAVGLFGALKWQPATAAAAEDWLARPLQGLASYVAPNGRALVVTFDKPVNVSDSVDWLERKLAGMLEAGPGERADASRATAARVPADASPASSAPDAARLERPPASSAAAAAAAEPQLTCAASPAEGPRLASSADQAAETLHQLQGLHLCERVLLRKSLKMLNRYQPRTCRWATRAQFIVELNKPVAAGPAVKLYFRRAALQALGARGRGRGSSAPTSGGAQTADTELLAELSRLPVDTLGLAMAPRLALTGPNQVSACGHFALSGHLWAPQGNLADNHSGAAKLEWSVERLGYLVEAGGGAGNGSRPASEASNSTSGAELRWQRLQRLVAETSSNNLVLDAQLLEQAPSLYEFRLGARLGAANVSASHQVSRVAHEAPVATLYGSHLLAQEQLLNPSQPLLLAADLRAPGACSPRTAAKTVKQMGLYWQVSDGRARFEQSYAPIYLAGPHSLPEQARLEFRLVAFYGLRVKENTVSSIAVATGDSLPEATISGGLLALTVGRDWPAARLRLSAAELEPPRLSWTPAGSQREESRQPAVLARQLQQQQQQQQPQQQQQHQHQQLSLAGPNALGWPARNQPQHFQWSCFDGKSAQPCARAPNSSLLDEGPAPRRPTALAGPAGSPELAGKPAGGPAGAEPLVDGLQSRQGSLELPLSSLQAGSQLWFGLQRVERQLQSRPQYALVNVRPGEAPSVRLGPILVGRQRWRAAVRNPLTGALLVVANVPLVIVGRLGPRKQVRSFAWRSTNSIQPLFWTSSASGPEEAAEDDDELVSELHLAASSLVPYAHYQIQLAACSGAGAHSVASISLDVVPGVTECQVELASLAGAGPLELSVSVNFCNIPLNLSPLTYQLFLLDEPSEEEPGDTSLLTATAAAAGATLAGDSGTSSSPTSSPASSPAPDELDEADEATLEARAQPLTGVQLTPVFLELDPLSLAAMQRTSKPESKFRIGARVCDRLAGCRMFFSRALLAGALLGPGEQQPGELVRLGQQALERARRLHTSGDSIKALASMAAVVGLAHRLQAPGSGAGERSEAQSRAAQLLQEASRQSLEVCAQSMAGRQLLYSQPGQTGLVSQLLAQIIGQNREQPSAAGPRQQLGAEQQALAIMANKGAHELRFRAIKLLTALTRRSTQARAGRRSNPDELPPSLAEPRSLQAAFEALFGAFGQHSLHQDRPLSRAAGEPPGAQEPASKFSNLLGSLSDALGANQSAPAEPAAGQHEPSEARRKSSGHGQRRRREDAVLGYLRLIRAAHKSLLAALAVQLPLGNPEQLRYSGLEAGAETRWQAPALSAPPARPEVASGRRQALTEAGQGQQQAPASSADIVSSLIHVTELTNETIDVDLHEFGFVSLRLDERLVARLKLELEAGSLECLPSNVAKCSSLVLVLSSFAGKAPYRSLDGQQLRVPVVEFGLLSPLDGSDLGPSLLASQRHQAAADSYQNVVTFTIPWSGPTESPPKRYRCFRFDEQANEWARVPQSEPLELLDAQSGDERRIRCVFGGFGGAFAAFTGEPPEPGSPAHLTLVLVLIVMASLVLVFALLGCFATSAPKAARDQNATDFRHPEHSHRAPPFAPPTG